MARRLTMAKQSTIQTLHESGPFEPGNRQIGRSSPGNGGQVCGFRRAEVAIRYRPNPIPGSQEPGTARRNHCEPFRAIILEKLEQGLQGTRIYQDLRDDHGFTASYSSVRRFLQGLRKSKVIPVRRIETDRGRRSSSRFRHCGLGCGRQRQETSALAVSRCAESLSQGIQRSRLAADHR